LFVGARHLRQSHPQPSGEGARPRCAKGEPFEFEAEGLLAVCIQHEIDHLDGKVFVEYLSQLKQGRIKGKLAKKARITA
jgi:hypothetical protein